MAEMSETLTRELLESGLTFSEVVKIQSQIKTKTKPVQWSPIMKISEHYRSIARAGMFPVLMALQDLFPERKYMLGTEFNHTIDGIRLAASKVLIKYVEDPMVASLIVHELHLKLGKFKVKEDMVQIESIEEWAFKDV